MRVLFLIALSLLIGSPAQAQKVAPTAPASATPVAKKKTPRPTVQISVRSVSGAKVYYGKKLLGTAPFKVRWPQNSGPLDLVVRKPGYFKVNTRAYTFEDSVLTVRLTPVSKAHTLLGYKAPIKTDEDDPEDEPDDPDAPTSGPTTPGSAPAPAVAPASGVTPLKPAGTTRPSVAPGTKKAATVGAGTKKPAPGVAPLRPASAAPSR